jgi:hypothetical protein
MCTQRFMMRTFGKLRFISFHMCLIIGCSKIFFGSMFLRLKTFFCDRTVRIIAVINRHESDHVECRFSDKAIHFMGRSDAIIRRIREARQYPYRSRFQILASFIHHIELFVEQFTIQFQCCIHSVSYA